MLLSLAHLRTMASGDGHPEAQSETFAAMIGTTFPVSFFMNKFRKLGYIDYHGYNGGCMCAAPS